MLAGAGPGPRATVWLFALEPHAEPLAAFLRETGNRVRVLAPAEEPPEGEQPGLVVLEVSTASRAMGGLAGLLRRLGGLPVVFLDAGRDGALGLLAQTLGRIRQALGPEPLAADSVELGELLRRTLARTLVLYGLKRLALAKLQDVYARIQEAPVRIEAIVADLLFLQRNLDGWEPPQIRQLLTRLAGDLEQLGAWIASEIDDVMPVASLRQTLEGGQAEADDLLLLLKYYCSKPVRNLEDRYKIDYLLTSYARQRLLPDTGMPNPMLIRSFLVDLYAGLDLTVSAEFSGAGLQQLERLTEQLDSIRELEDFVGNDFFGRLRRFKIELGRQFFHPGLLSHLVVLNLLARARFESLVQDEQRQLEVLTRRLKEREQVVMEGSPLGEFFRNREEVIEFVRSLREMLQGDYAFNLELCRTASTLKRLLLRSSGLYELRGGRRDPPAADPDGGG